MLRKLAASTNLVSAVICTDMPMNRSADVSEQLLYPLAHREILQLAHRENKAYTLGLSQLLVFIAVTMNTDGYALFSQ